MSVRMELECLLAVRLLDGVLVGVTRHIEQPIVVLSLRLFELELGVLELLLERYRWQLANVS